MMTRRGAREALSGSTASALVPAFIRGTELPRCEPEILHGLNAVQDDIGEGTERRPEAGSTLIELIVVLALVAVLFGIAVPALTAVPESERGLSARDSLQLRSAASGRVVRGDSLVAFPDGRTLPRGGHRAK